MRVSVLPDAMPAGADRADERRIAPRMLPDHEKRGANVVAVEQVERRGGRVRAGAVVEGQVERARPVRPPPEEVGEEPRRRARKPVAEERDEHGVRC